MRILQKGFTLVELLIVIAIIGVLAAIGVANYGASVRKSGEALTKGNLGTIRSAVSIYYSDNDGVFPDDDLTSITRNSRYLPAIPLARTHPYHGDQVVVTAETSITDTGGWSYDNSANSAAWGAAYVGCVHQDSRGESWSSY